MTTWEMKDVEAHLVEVMNRAATDGPQFLAKDGAEVAVVLSFEEYQRLVNSRRTLADVLLGGPKFDDFEIPPRQIDPPRDLNMSDDGDGVAAE